MRVNTHDGRGNVVATETLPDDPLLLNAEARQTALVNSRPALRKIVDGTTTLTAIQRERLYAAVLLRLVNEAIADNQATD
jgi:hypothetical protein